MARTPSKHPTDGELEILRILWADGQSTLSAICQRLRQERNVATTTVATMLKVMLEKGLVKRQAARASRDERGYQWSAALSQSSTAGSFVEKIVAGVFDGSASRLMTHLVETDSLTEQELTDLKKLVDAKRANHKANGKKGK